MKKKWGNWLLGGAILTAALMLAMAPWGSAMAGLIDNFETTGQTLMRTTVGSSSNSASGGGILGGTRDFFLNYTGGTQSFSMAANANPSRFTFNQETGVSGNGTVTWDDMVGAAKDLTEGATVNTVVMERAYSDLPTTIQIKVTSGASSATWTIALPGGGLASETDYSLAFSSFSGYSASIFQNVDSITLIIPNVGTTVEHDLAIGNLGTVCVATTPTVDSLFATPATIPWDQSTTLLCWDTSADTTRAELDGVPVPVDGCKDVGVGTHYLDIWNECTPNTAQITIEKDPPPTGACCVLDDEGDPEIDWDDVYRCDTDVTQAECEATEGSKGWEEGATNCDLLDCEAPPPPPPPVVPAFNPLGLLIFAGLIPLGWVLANRRKK